MGSVQRISVLLMLIAVIGVQCTTSVELVIPPCFPTSISTNSTGVSYNTTYQYNSSNKVTSTKSTSTMGNQTVTVNATFTYDGDGNIVTASEISSTGSSATRNYTYDISHNLTQETYQVDGIAISKSTYQYNSTNQLIKVLYGNGSGSTTSTSSFTYQTPVARNPTTVTSSLGSSWAYTYDTKPNPLKVLFVSVQPDNNIIKMTNTSGGSVTTTTYTYQYDSKGFPIARTGSDGETKAYTYFCK